MAELGRFGEASFDKRVKAAVTPVLLGHVQRLARLEANQGDDSGPWNLDISTMVDGYTRALNDRDHTLPYDFEQIYGRQQGRVKFRGLVHQLGQLLQVWPEVLAAGALLREKGETACPALPPV